MRYILIILTLASTVSFSQDFYSDLNKYRASRFMRPLSIDTSLEIESRTHINKIIHVYKGSLRHGAMNNKSHNFKAEVLAKNCDLNAWLNHKPHRKILLSRKARKIGFVKIDGIACARLSD